jgi:hypothetical protein
MSTHQSRPLSLRIPSLDAVFDNQDPHELSFRRMNDEWLEYVLELMDDHPGRGPLDTSLQITEDALAGWSHENLGSSIRRELHHYEEFLTRRLRENFRLGRVSLALGLLVLVFFVALSMLANRLPVGGIREVLHEGLLIIGWVALWRPVEILLYDWWPIVADRRKVRRLLAGNITISSH